jgi:exodeoxyribonuclease VII small subunit
MKDVETRLTRLEFLAQRIKENDLPIEEALKVFEEGMKLSTGLKKDLDKIQGKVEILLNEPDSTDEPITEPFEADENGENADD